MKVVHLECCNNTDSTTIDNTHWIVAIDRSGSMGDLCRDGKSRLEHVLHSVNGLIGAWRENHSSLGTHYLSLVAFDHEPVTLCRGVPMDEAGKCDAIIDAALKQLKPRGSTDIGKVLSHNRKLARSFRVTAEANEASCRIHDILLTDGEPTMGILHADQLAAAQKRQDDTRYVRIGFGRSHNSHVLSCLSRGPGSMHYFVDTLEKSGMILGEVAHRLTHEIVPDLGISLPSGAIFDPEALRWGSSLQTGMLSKGETRTYLATAELQGPIEVADPGVKIWWSDDEGDVQRHVDRGEVQRLCRLASCQAACTMTGPRAKEACDLLTLAEQGGWTEVMRRVDAEPALCQAWPVIYDFSLLHMALAQGHDDIAKRLVEHGCEVKPTRSGTACGDLRPDLELPSWTLQDALKKAMQDMKTKAENADDESAGWYTQLADDAYVGLLSIDNPLGHMFMQARQLSHQENRAYNTRSIDELREFASYRSFHQMSDASVTPVASMGAVQAAAAGQAASQASQNRFLD